MEILPNLHLVPNVMANPYIIVDGDGLTLIDTGLPGSHGKILRYLSDRGYGPKKLVRIVVTHSDIDHVGGLSHLKQATGARVYASAIEADAISKGIASRQIRSRGLGRRLLMALQRILFRPQPVTVDQIVSDGDTIPALGGLQVLETPGHTPGHISLFSPSTGVLFVGDSIVSLDSGLAVSRPGITWDAAQAAASARRQSALNPQVVCSGHGPVVKDAAGKMPAA